MTRHILLTQGKTAIVDDEDYERINQYKWYAYRGRTTWYARRSIVVGGIRMHRAIIDVPPGMVTDHHNGNGLDNRRANLCSCTASQHRMRGRKRKGCSSQYKGVAWDKHREKWQSYINIEGKRRHLGRFEDEEEAARTYDQAARELFGNFARPNFQEVPTSGVA